MKALQLHRPRSFHQIEVPQPDLGSAGPERLVVRPLTLSLCGSDIPFYTGSKRQRRFPLPAGAPIHECLGEVIASSSAQYAPGERVIAIPDSDQGLAEQFLAQAAKAVRLPAALAEDENSVLIQPLSTVMNAVDRLGDVSGRSVTIVGLGSIGLLFCWLLRRRGAGSLVGIDPLAERCRMAEALGATRTVASRSLEAVQAGRAERENGGAADICIEAVGHQMETLNDCLELARPQGTVLAFGVPDQAVYAVEYETFFRRNLHLLAVVTPVWSDYLAQACALYASTRSELAPLVTHRLPVLAAGQAFSLYEQHADGVVKILLDGRAW